MKWFSINAALLLILSHSCDARSQFHPKNPSLVSIPTKDAARLGKKPAFTSQHIVSSVHSGGSADGGTKSTMKAAIFNLVKGIVGAGVLSLPAGVAAFGDSKSAAIPAVALVSLAGALSGYNFSLIGRICAYTGASSYAGAWENSIGEATAWIPAACCTLKTFLAVLAYSMILSETFQGIFQSVGLTVSRSQSLIGLTSAVLLPLCLMKNLASLAPFSLLGIIGMLLTVACMAIRYFDGTYALPAGKFLKDLSVQPLFGSKGASAVFSPNTFILVCMLSTAYMAHFNAPKFYNELENNTIERYNTLVSTSFGISTLVFSVATALGFSTFGANSDGFILLNYSSKDTLIGLSRVLVAFALIFT
jgi:amino acid permease